MWSPFSLSLIKLPKTYRTKFFRSINVTVVFLLGLGSDFLYEFQFPCDALGVNWRELQNGAVNNYLPDEEKCEET